MISCDVKCYANFCNAHKASGMQGFCKREPQGCYTTYKASKIVRCKEVIKVKERRV